MPQQRLNKNYYNFAQGFNSDANPLEFPENFTLEEQNFFLNLNGSRRRRGGLALESGGALVSIPTTSGYVSRCHKWSNVAGLSEKNFHVVQLGSTLYFFEDGYDPASQEYQSFSIDLAARKVSTATDAECATNPVDIAYGRGHMFVVGKYIEPFWASYDPDANSFTVSTINITERDFEGIDDGIAITAQPVSPSTSHTYNLQNRGWTTAQLTSFRAAQPNEPSKAMINWLGLRRATTASVAEQDWTKEFSSAKLVAELFQDSSAPTGHFLRDPFNTSTVTGSDATNLYTITTWSVSGTTAGPQTVTVTVDRTHGLSIGSAVTISGQNGLFDLGFGGGTVYFPFPFNGVQTVVTVPTTTSFTFTYDFPEDFSSWYSQYETYGTVSTSVVSNPSGLVSPYRPTTVGFFAGRIWYAGTPYSRVSNKLFFSQVIEADAQYGKCYQVADPTQEEFSDLVDSDGGVLVIPEIAQVVKVLPIGSSLLVFATNGVWQVGPGGGGYFTATGYSVRKIFEIGVTTAASIVVAEGIPHWWSNSGIYRLSQDTNSGYLSPESLTQKRLDYFYSEITQAKKENVQGTYDDINKRIVWLYDDTAAHAAYSYDAALVYDMRLDAFTTLKFGYSADAYVASLFALKDTANAETKLKFLGITDTNTTLTVGDFNNRTDYTDLGNTEVPAYLVTGHEVLGDASRFRFANYVHVYMGKTETGFTEEGVTGASSILMQSRWDWTDATVSGKWGAEQQVYRHTRQYVPANLLDTYDDGYPVLVTKNKILGRGRSLALKFTVGDGKDAHIYGWQVEYLANSEV